MKATFNKALIFLSLLTICPLTSAQTETLPIVKDFTIEAKEAKNKKLPILVLFMSTTCPYCETVLQDFLLPMHHDPEFKDKVILRQIESGSSENLIDFDGTRTTYSSFSRKHKVWGVPHVMLFDSKGNELTSIIGLLTIDFYYAYLINAIDESLEKVKSSNKWFN